MSTALILFYEAAKLRNLRKIYSHIKKRDKHKDQRKWFIFISRGQMPKYLHFPEASSMNWLLCARGI